MIRNKGRRRLMGLKSPRNLLLLWKLRTWRRREWFSLFEETFWFDCGSSRNCLIQFLFLHPHEPSPKYTWKHTEGDNFRHSFWNSCDTQLASINVVNSKKKKNRQCMCTLRLVRATILAVGKQLLIRIPRVCVCSITYPAYNAHAPCYIVCGLSWSNIFFHVISSTARFSKNVFEYKMCVLISSATFVWNISHSENWARYDKKCILVFM